MTERKSEPVTGGNQEILAALARIEANVDRLLALWDEHGHILIAFKRGGLLAARTAAKAGNGRG